MTSPFLAAIHARIRDGFWFVDPETRLIHRFSASEYAAREISGSEWNWLPARDVEHAERIVEKLKGGNN